MNQACISIESDKISFLPLMNVENLMIRIEIETTFNQIDILTRMDYFESEIILIL